MKHRKCISLLTTTSIVVLIAVMASFASCSSEETIPKSKEDELLEEYEPFIRDYLAERYGEGVGKDAEIEVEIPDEYVFESAI